MTKGISPGGSAGADEGSAARGRTAQESRAPAQRREGKFFMPDCGRRGGGGSGFTPDVRVGTWDSRPPALFRQAREETRLTRWPVQGSLAEQVDVQVGHAFAAIRTAVDHHAIAR